MKLLVLGVDHNSAPAAVREAIAFEGGARDLALARLRDSHPECEFVILSTCNRVEFYAGSQESANLPDQDEFASRVADLCDYSLGELADHLVAHHDEAVITHLFRVAASLESMVMGEGQILGQVRAAYRAAEESRAVGPVFHRLFQEALRVGKLVREETGLDQGKLSVASVAVDVAKGVFDHFSDKAVLVIGAGKVAELTLQHLVSLKPGRVLVCNRDAGRAREIADRFAGRVIPFERLDDALTEADVIVSTTSAPEPIVDLARFTRVQRARRNRLALVLDIAMPRDFDPRVGELDQVMLYNVDDLRAQVEQNAAARRKQAEPARLIIEREAADCLEVLRHQRHTGILLRELGNYADQVRLNEQEQLFARLSHLDEADREAIAHTLHRLQNKFLHHPRSALRSTPAASHSEPTYSLLGAVRHLFGLSKNT